MVFDAIKNKARYYLEKAENIHPENDALYSLKGAIYLDKKNYRKAIHRFKQAYRINEKNDYYVYDLVIALILSEEYGEALKYWAELPNNDFKRNAINEVIRHISLYPEKFINYALTRIPNDAIIVEFHSEKLYHNREFESALRSYISLKNIVPDDSFINIRVASALMMLDRHEEALHEVKHIEFTIPDDQLLHQLTLAAIHKSLGNKSEAEAALANAKSINAIEHNTVDSYLYHRIVGNDDKCKEIKKTIDDGTRLVSYFKAETEFILNPFGTSYYS